MDELFFLASKVLWVLMSPTSVLLWLMLLMTLFLWLNYWRIARIIATVMAIFSLIVVAYPLSDALMTPLETRFSPPQTLPEQIDGIIVLGGAELLLLSQIWQQPHVGDGAERILAAAELSRLYPDTPILFTGASNLVQRQNIDEGDVITQLFTQAGVPEERLMIESKARNTAENFVLVKAMLPKSDGLYLLVTSAFHMPRTMGVANRHQLNVIPYPVDYRSYPAAERYWDFDAHQHMQTLETAWHEWLGLLAYFVTGKTDQFFPAEIRATEQNQSAEHALN